MSNIVDMTSEVYRDGDGYECFKQYLNGSSGIIWTLHSSGWEAFVDDPDEEDSIYQTWEHSFPSNEDLDAAAEAYASLGREVTRGEQEGKNEPARSDEKAVLYAILYAWYCPVCDTRNEEAEMSSAVTCQECNNEFDVDNEMEYI